MKVFSLGLFSSVAAAICDFGTVLGSCSDDTRCSASGYGYDGPNGPLVWHKLSPNNALCATGKNQSPINIDPSREITVDGSSLAFQLYSYPHGAELENLGNAVQVRVNGSVMLNGWVYNLCQFHFHTPSEHHLLGEHYPAEVHFVAQNDVGSVAVIGFFVEISVDDDRVSSFLTAALSRVKEVSRPGQAALTGALNHTDLQYHLTQSDVYQYNGSLTTPPCSENVLFSVVARPLYVHPREYRALKQTIKFNSRYVQNRPGRVNLSSGKIYR